VFEHQVGHLVADAIAPAPRVVSLGRLTEAEEMCREAVGLDPDNAQAHFHLGTVLGMLDCHADAEAEFRRAIHLDPGIPEAHYNLGSALTAQSRRSEAKAAFRESERVEAARKAFRRPQSENTGNIRLGLDSSLDTAYRVAPQQGPGNASRLKDLMAEGNLSEVADELYEQTVSWIELDGFTQCRDGLRGFTGG
jgi:tetratricopeptide (TPR) repeat protein